MIERSTTDRESDKGTGPFGDSFGLFITRKRAHSGSGQSRRR